MCQAVLTGFRRWQGGGLRVARGPTTIRFVFVTNGLVMARQRILVSWIGHADLRAFAQTLPPPKRFELLKIVRAQPLDPPGPTKSLVDNEQFDEIHLLSTYEARWDRPFVRWLGRRVELHRVQLDAPTDYESIFEAADRELSAVVEGRSPADYELSIHLSPGTPAMTAIWVLLGKTRYPATFYQTHAGRAWQTEIPFEITADFLPELLKAPDAHLQHLAAKSPGEVEGFKSILGDSQAIRVAVGRAERAAVRDVPVLILGESGTGKELFARAIHKASHRRDRAFVAINCAAVPKELLESELFGHVKGAFTGATKDKFGAFDKTDGGTLFLDEIGDCDPALQAKLLRVMQPPPGTGPCKRVFWPVGGEKERVRDVRIIAATNRPLATDVSQGRFREDLYYRLAVITVALPPLRERRGDIPSIAAHLLDQINKEFRQQEPGYRDRCLSTRATAFVKRFNWSGNVRQLHNALVQAATMCAGDVIERSDLEAAVASEPARDEDNVLELPLGNGFSLDKHLENIQRQYLRRAMQEAGGVKTRAAKLLGMKNYQTLDAQLKRLKVKWK